MNTKLFGSNSDSMTPTRELSAGFSALVSLVGLGLAAWGVLGRAESFSHGPWPVVLVGAAFSLFGFQLFRTAVLPEKLGEPATSVISALVFGGFCALFCWAALSPLVVVDTPHQFAADNFAAHLACGVLTLLCGIAAFRSIARLLGQLRNRR